MAIKTHHSHKIKLFAQSAFTLAIVLMLSARIWQVGHATLRELNGKSFTLKGFLKADPQKVNQGAQFKTLNRMMPDFHKFLSLTLNNGFVDESELEPYIRYYQQVITYFPELPEGYGILGYCYYLEGHIPQAAQAWQKAAFINPDYFYYWYNLGVISLKLGQYDQAKGFLAKAITTKPEVTLRSLFSTFIYHQLLSVNAIPPENISQNLLYLYQRSITVLQTKPGQPFSANLEAVLF